MPVTWRLQKLPTPLEVAALVEQGILTVEEARFMLLRDTGYLGKIEVKEKEGTNE